jgi:AraC-like DNA-binding protein
VPINVIAERCGWPSDSFLRRIFRRKTGHSLSEERAVLTKDNIAQMDGGVYAPLSRKIRWSKFALDKNSVDMR